MPGNTAFIEEDESLPTTFLVTLKELAETGCPVAQQVPPNEIAQLASDGNICLLAHCEDYNGGTCPILEAIYENHQTRY
ncbi:MAG: hypothetical protein WC508_04135 [Patescibacteria group bacterium]